MKEKKLLEIIEDLTGALGELKGLIEADLEEEVQEDEVQEEKDPKEELVKFILNHEEILVEWIGGDEKIVGVVSEVITTGGEGEPAQVNSVFSFGRVDARVETFIHGTLVEVKVVDFHICREAEELRRVLSGYTCDIPPDGARLIQEIRVLSRGIRKFEEILEEEMEKYLDQE